jgi:hypothetical protein
MPTVSLTKSYADDTDLTEEQLDDLKESIESALNTTKLDNANIQTGGISADNLATSSVTESKIAAGAVTVNKLGDLSVSTGKIAANAVTRAKLEALGQQISSSCGNFSTTSTSYTAVTNLSVSLTTTGRPVWVGLQSDGTEDGGGGFRAGTVGYTAASGGSTYTAKFRLRRGNTDIAFYTVQNDNANDTTAQVPCGSVWFIDTPAAGTYTYTVAAKDGNAGFGDTCAASVAYCKLVAFEF